MALPREDPELAELAREVRDLADSKLDNYVAWTAFILDATRDARLYDAEIIGLMIKDLERRIPDGEAVLALLASALIRLARVGEVSGGQAPTTQTVPGPGQRQT